MADTVQKGSLIDHTAASDIAAGGVVVIGQLVGVAPRPIASGAVGAVAIDGVYSLPKASTGSASQTITAGARVYYYSVSGIATTTVTGVIAGYAVAEAVTGASTVNVYLDR